MLLVSERQILKQAIWWYLKVISQALDNRIQLQSLVQLLQSQTIKHSMLSIAEIMKIDNHLNFFSLVRTLNEEESQWSVVAWTTNLLTMEAGKVTMTGKLRWLVSSEALIHLKNRETKFNCKINRSSRLISS